MIIGVHFPDLDKDIASACIKTFYRLRELGGVGKKPATRELINLVHALMVDTDFKISQFNGGNIPFLGALFKKVATWKMLSSNLVGCVSDGI